MTDKMIGDPNQTAGHEPRVREWEQSEEGKAWIADADEREKAEKESQQRIEQSMKDLEEQSPEDPNLKFGETALEDGDSDSDDDGAPAKSASKQDWVDYAVSQGADKDEAEGKTKDELQAEYGK